MPGSSVQYSRVEVENAEEAFPLFAAEYAGLASALGRTLMQQRQHKELCIYYPKGKSSRDMSEKSKEREYRSKEHESH